MKTTKFKTSSSPVIHIETNGNLHLLGHEEDILIYKGGPPEAVTEDETGQVYQIHSNSSCQIQVPTQATVIIATVNGNGQFKGLTRPITIEKIGGNLNLYQIGPISVQKIYGNLRAQDVQGDLEVHAVYGNITAHEISGNLQVHEKAKGNLIIREVGSLKAGALGNATLGIDPQPDLLYHVEASGNIHCSVPLDASVEVNLRSNSRRIHLSFPDQQEMINENEYAIIREGGEARLTLIAKGYIHLTSMTTDEQFSPELAVDIEGNFAEITEEISGLIDLQMAALEQQLNERLAHIPELEDNIELYNDIDEIVEQARQYSTSAALRAQEKAQKAAQRAQAKLNQKLEKARRKSERRRSRLTWSSQDRGGQWPQSRPAHPPSDPVTEEERLLILKMLEENKISLEEADQLLAALEGKDQ
jgi:hypothetical protein